MEPFCWPNFPVSGPTRRKEKEGGWGCFYIISNPSLTPIYVEILLQMDWMHGTHLKTQTCVQSNCFIQLGKDKAWPLEPNRSCLWIASQLEAWGLDPSVDKITSSWQKVYTFGLTQGNGPNLTSPNKLDLIVWQNHRLGLIFKAQKRWVESRKPYRSYSAAFST